MARVYVSVGSNIERERHVRAAVDALRARYAPLALSRVYQCPAQDFAGEDFYNLVVGFDTGDTPEAVAERLGEIEAANGRVREGSGLHSRTLDLDLLLYDDLVVHRPGLVLPRPDILHYAFVLRPLAELAPTAHHPLNGRRFDEIWARFDQASQPLRPIDLAL